MTSHAAFLLAVRLMNEHGLHGWSFRFDHAKRRCGVCRFTSKTIQMSRHYVEHNDETIIRNTILHEIAHALVGPGHGHGPVWQAMALKVGARAVRCNAQAIMPQGGWQATCGCCKYTYRRHRLRNRNAVYSCGTCGKERGRLEWHRVSEGAAV